MHHGYLQLHFVCQVTWDSDYGSTVRVAGQLMLQPGPAAEPFFCSRPQSGLAALQVTVKSEQYS